MKKTRSLGKALMLLSLTAMSGYSLKALAFDPFPTSFSDLFDELDSFHRPIRNRQTVETDLPAQAKALQDAAQKMTQAANDFASEISKKETDRSFDKSIRAISESQVAVNDAADNIRLAVHTVSRARLIEEASKKPKFSLQTHTDEKTEDFVVTATLPEIAKDDLKITVKTVEDYGKERNVLHITTQQKKDSANKTSSVFSSSSTSSSRFIHGRQEVLTVNNGDVEISVDLPADINSDLLVVQKTMTFDKGVLILSFPMSKKTRKKETVLRFNSQPEEATRKVDLK